MKVLLVLGIFEGMTTQEEVKNKIKTEFDTTEEEVKDYNILAAYVDYGSYEGTGFILMEDNQGNLYENHSSHCSCYGNEGQWKPEKTDLGYLKSSKFSCCCYGQEDILIKEHIAKL